MRKAKVVLIVVVLLCILSTVAAFVAFKLVIEPRLDYVSTVVVDGKEVKVVKKTPLTLNNEILEGKNKFFEKLNALVALNKGNSSKQEVLTKLGEVNEVNKVNTKAIIDLEKVIENYEGYKEFMDATKKFYSDYHLLVNELFSQANIDILFKETLTQAEYDKIIAAQDSYNNNKIDAAFKTAQQDFINKFSIK